MNFFSTSYKKSSDEILMLLIAEGKKSAFDELYHRYSKKMHFFFYKMLSGDTDKANDFTQDLFLKLIEKPHLFNKEMRFSTWLYSVAGNMCRNEYRRNSIRNEIKTDIELDSYHYEEEKSSHSIDYSSFQGALSKELDALDADHKMIFLLRFQEHLPIQEISTILQCPEGTVKSRLFYTIKKLSGKLTHYNPNL